MSKETQTTDPTQVKTPPVSPTSVNTAPGPGFDRADVFDDAGKTWKSKYFGAQGATQQADARFRDERATFNQQITDLTATIGQRDATIEALNAQISAQEAIAATVPELQTQIETLQADTARANKYKALMGYPGLLSVQVTEDVTDGDGVTSQVTVNPILRLIESSTLEGATLEAELRRLASVQQSAQIATTPTVPLTSGASPNPSPPETVTIESLQAKADDARARAGAGDREARGEMIAAFEEIRKLSQQSQG